MIIGYFFDHGHKKKKFNITLSMLSNGYYRFTIRTNWYKHQMQSFIKVHKMWKMSEKAGVWGINSNADYNLKSNQLYCTLNEDLSRIFFEQLKELKINGAPVIITVDSFEYFLHAEVEKRI